jgi:hypothetical protein
MPMAKSKSPTKPAELPLLTEIEQQVMAFLLNSVAFENYGDCCGAEDLAERFGRTPGRFMATLRKMTDKGYITLQGETMPWVYPTIEALRQQDKTLSDADAWKILKKIGGN